MLRHCAIALTAAFLLAPAAMTPALAQDTPPEPGLTRLTQFAEFGEPKYPEGFAHFDYVNPDAPKGGEVRLAAFGTFERLDSITVGGNWPLGLGLVLDSLMTGSEDELSSYYPLIAQSVDVPDDLSYAIFNINPAARYHDGEPIRAGDFVFALEHIKRDARPLLKQFWTDITSAEALDDLRIRFNFATTNNWKTLGLAAGMSPLPVHYWTAEGRDITRPSIQPALYSGAYDITTVDPGRSITYTRFPDYWAKDLPVAVGQNNFDRVTYIYFRDDDVMFEAFTGGTYDFRGENRAQRWSTAYNFPAVLDGRVLREEMADNMPRGFIGFIFNTRRAPLDNVDVRHALSYLFDFEWTQRNVFYGQYARAQSYFPNSDYGISDFPLPEGAELAALEPYRDQLPPELFTTPFRMPATDGSGQIRQQLREAWRLFGQAGWQVQDGRLVNDAGQQMRLRIVDDSASLEPVIGPFIANMQRAGIDAAFEVIDSAQMERRLQDFNFDMVYLAANFFPPPGPEMQTYFLSAMADQKDSANWAGIRNPVVDALLAEILRQNQARDLEGLKATNRALDRVLLWNYYILPSYYNDATWLAYWDKFGRPEQRPFYSTGFYSTWWYDPSGSAATAGR